MQNKRKNTVGKILIYLLLILLALSFLAPLAYIAINSVKTQFEYLSDPFNVILKGAHFSNYKEIFNNFKLGRYLFNTAFLTVTKLIWSLPISICASYVFAKLRFVGKSIIYPAVISAMFIPFQVIMIPLYVMLAKVSLINTYFGFILVSGTLLLPSSILLMTASFRSIPNDVLDAATIDGCGFLRTVFQVVAPMGKPTIVICLILNFLSSWNDIMTPMVILKDTSKQMVMPALNMLVGVYSANVPLQFTGIIVSTVPALVIYVLLQKQIIMGITDGSVK